jgi:Domain of Unknown Function (DUF928)
MTLIVPKINRKLAKSVKWMLTIALIGSSTTHYPIQVTAQTPKAATLKQLNPPQKRTKPVFRLPKVPTGLGTVSGRRTGMGSRDNCPNVATELTALVPLYKQQKGQSSLEIVGGVTTSERPTFWFNVPYTKDSPNLNAEFLLTDSVGKEIHKTPITLPSKPGVISVSLPPTKTLEIGKTYRWYLKVRCSQQQTARVPIYVEGEIQRVNLDFHVAQQLNTATDCQQKATIYAANGIWFDSITELAQIRLANPNNVSIAADWQSLLQSVGLNNIN